MSNTGQDFFWDFETRTFYYVNYQEQGYIVITEENKELYHFLSNIFCKRWIDRPEIISTFRLVEDIKDIYFNEDGSAIRLTNQ